MKRILLIAVSGLLLSGCTIARIGEPPKLADDVADLESKLNIMPAMPRPAPSSGSLWTDSGANAALVRDTRAYRINDMVTVRLAESSTGSNNSATDLSKSSSNSFGASVAFGLEDPTAGAGDFNLGNVLSSDSSSDFSGDGTTSRTNSLSGLITCRVSRVLPNGDLMVTGQKTVMVNREKHIITLVGTVRPVDIDATNQVTSSSVGDLTVRLWGQGEVDSTVRQGWFMRVMNRIWPF